MKTAENNSNILRDEENKEMQKQLEEREAGVAELFEFYSRIEAIYTSTLKALEEGQTVRTRAATNFR
jgi:hypothetical protein